MDTLIGEVKISLNREKRTLYVGHKSSILKLPLPKKTACHMHFYSCIIHAYEMHVECCELAVSNGCIMLANGMFTCILHVIPLHFPCCFPATTLQLCYMCYAFKRVQHEFNSVFHAFPKKVKCMSHSFKLHAKCIQTCKPYEFKQYVPCISQVE